MAVFSCLVVRIIRSRRHLTERLEISFKEDVVRSVIGYHKVRSGIGPAAIAFISISVFKTSTSSPVFSRLRLNDLSREFMRGEASCDIVLAATCITVNPCNDSNGNRWHQVSPMRFSGYRIKERGKKKL